MEIRYKLEQEDFVNYNLNYINDNSALKRNNFIQRILGPCIFMGFAAVTSMKSDIPSSYWYGLFGLVSVVWFFVYPRFFNKLVKKNIGKLFKDKENDKLLEEKHIILSEDGMIEKNNKDNLIRWKDFKSFKELNDYIYIYISDVDAYILPKRDLSLDEIDNILKICKEKIGG